jgi:hypothetical protein
VQKVGALKGLVSSGFDPKEAVSAVGLDHIKWNGLPALLDPARQAEMAEMAAEAAAEAPPAANQPPRPPTKSHSDRAAAAREDIAKVGVLTLADFLEGQRERVVEALRKSLPASKTARLAAVKAPPEWWDTNVENAELAAAMRIIYDRSSRSGLQVVADTLNRIVPNKAVSRITADLLTHGGERIADINARTLQAISIELAEGTKRGYSVAQLIDGVPAEGFRGVLQVGMDNGVGVWGDARAETIARTETALSYNRATLKGYDEFRVKQVQAIDGDEDDECAARNGSTFDLDDALGIEDHPNGTLDWAPVV